MPVVHIQALRQILTQKVKINELIFYLKSLIHKIQFYVCKQA